MKSIIFWLCANIFTRVLCGVLVDDQQKSYVYMSHEVRNQDIDEKIEIGDTEAHVIGKRNPYREGVRDYYNDDDGDNKMTREMGTGQANPNGCKLGAFEIRCTFNFDCCSGYCHWSDGFFSTHTCTEPPS